MRASFRSLIPLLVLSATACAVVGSDFAGDANRESPNPGNDDPIVNYDAGTSPAPDAESGRSEWRGSPLCGDPTGSCLPDDPRSEPGCGNEIMTEDSGAAPSSSSSSGERGGEDDSPTDNTSSSSGGGERPNEEEEDAGVSVRARACRVKVTGEGPLNECASAGYAGEGEGCTSSAQCGAALDCVRAHEGDLKGICRAYCCKGVCGEGTDGAARFCDATRMADRNARVPVCMPVKGCRLLGPDQCSESETCAVVRESDGTTGCVEIGAADVGDPCDVEHCAAGLTCLGQVGARTCYQLCSDTGAACPTGQECTWAPPAFQQAGIGVCVAVTSQRAY